MPLSTGSFAIPAEAGPFDRLKAKVQKVERDVRRVERTVREVEQAVDTVEAVADGDISPTSIIGGSRGGSIMPSGYRAYPDGAKDKQSMGAAGSVPAKYVN